MRVHERQRAGRVPAARHRRGARPHRAGTGRGPRRSGSSSCRPRQPPDRGGELRRRDGAHAGRRVPHRRRAARPRDRRRARRAQGPARRPHRRVAARPAGDGRSGEAGARRRLLQDQRVRLHGASRRPRCSSASRRCAWRSSTATRRSRRTSTATTASSTTPPAATSTSATASASSASISSTSPGYTEIEGSTHFLFGAFNCHWRRPLAESLEHLRHCGQGRPRDRRLPARRLGGADRHLLPLLPGREHPGDPGRRARRSMDLLRRSGERPPPRRCSRCSSRRLKALSGLTASPTSLDGDGFDEAGLRRDRQGNPRPSRLLPRAQAAARVPRRRLQALARARRGGAAAHARDVLHHRARALSLAGAGGPAGRRRRRASGRRRSRPCARRRRPSASGPRPRRRTTPTGTRWWRPRSPRWPASQNGPWTSTIGRSSWPARAASSTTRRWPTSWRPSSTSAGSDRRRPRLHAGGLVRATSSGARRPRRKQLAERYPSLLGGIEARRRRRRAQATSTGSATDSTTTRTPRAGSTWSPRCAPPRRWPESWSSAAARTPDAGRWSRTRAPRRASWSSTTAASSRSRRSSPSSPTRSSSGSASRSSSRPSCRERRPVRRAAARRPLVLADAAAEPRFARDPYIAKQRPKSLLCLAMQHQGRLVGVLYLENNAATNAFSVERVELLQFVAAQAAVAVENANLYGELRSATDQLRRSERHAGGAGRRADRGAAPHAGRALERDGSGAQDPDRPSAQARRASATTRCRR